MTGRRKAEPPPTADIRYPPTLSQNTDDVLTERCGFDVEVVGRLREEGMI